MAIKNGHKRPSLTQGLDREVYQIVKKYLDEQTDSVVSVKSYAVYDWIRNSNSSLRRRPRKQLEDSIERVLTVMQEENSEDEDEMEPIEGNFGDNEEQGKRSMDYMNKLIATSMAPSGTSTPTPNGEAVEKKKTGQRGPDGQPASKKQKRADNRDSEKPKIDVSPPTHVRLEDVGGVDNIKRELKHHLVLPLLCPEEYAKRRIPIPRGILLHGPPGCGKTVISRAFAAKLGVPFIEILGPSVVSGMSGESERQVREHFEKAKEVAPCLIFIDEIDVIAPKRDSAQSQMEKRIVAQLLISMDSLAMESNDGKPVIVLAATNRPDSIDPALRRGGRFDTEINMGVPNEHMRELILRAQTRDTHISNDVDFLKLAKMTPGFVGADLRDLVGKAGTWSMDKYREALEKQATETEIEMDIDGESTSQKISDMDKSITRLINRVRDKEKARPVGFEDTSITMAAFEAVLPGIQPSSKREGFATVPDVTWADVGALGGIREELQMAIVDPIMHPERYKKVGIITPTGILLWGPPGCGKTLLAKAVAAESKANFISVKGPELLNKYVGESESAVRKLFIRARASQPCVVFFDELDALAPRRNDSLSEASARVVNTLLTELDGLSERQGIYVIAATNRPDIIDPAILRPGRLETLLCVELPRPEEREEILRTLIKSTPINSSHAIIASRDVCNNFSGADLQSLLRKAGQVALKRMSQNRGPQQVELADFEEAVSHVKPSVQNAKEYQDLKKKFASTL